VVTATGPVLLLQLSNDRIVLDWPGVLSLAVVSAAVVHLAGVISGRGARRAPSWSLALALLTSAVLMVRVPSLLDYAFPYGSSASGPAEGSAEGMAEFALAQAVALLGVGVPLGVLARRELSRLPGPAPGERPSLPPL
jgi:hypothetical protein